MDHEGSFCGSEGRGGDDEVAFIFTVGAVEYEDKVTGACEEKVSVGWFRVEGSCWWVGYQRP